MLYTAPHHASSHHSGPAFVHAKGADGPKMERRLGGAVGPPRERGGGGGAYMRKDDCTMIRRITPSYVALRSGSAGCAQGCEERIVFVFPSNPEVRNSVLLFVLTHFCPKKGLGCISLRAAREKTLGYPFYGGYLKRLRAKRAQNVFCVLLEENVC